MEPENILVVDDEEAIREVVSTMLESRGYHCTSVSNGRAAQDLVRKQTPDLVLSDMIMPEMDGIKLLDWLRNYDRKSRSSCSLRSTPFPPLSKPSDAAPMTTSSNLSRRSSFTMASAAPYSTAAW